MTWPRGTPWRPTTSTGCSSWARSSAGPTEAQVLALGEAGVGNTTVAAALCSLLLGLDANLTVGLGAGGDSATVERKRGVVEMAVSRALAKYGKRRARGRR